ncbi:MULTISPECIES: RidA family protein [Microbacterium]|uniref:Reactive intermediate/imine deaminase n=1 Tax=Microbacterium wangchenii TaxID=2541726 RepID=A0ABX5SY74_9MICO|nr:MULTISPECIES: Rid family detoxifying hydrolase [Microbacterium]MCK6065867.1 Rid family detoxifying hydrolase [Microbacterium sp. EYE_512]QBR90171.1 reactive intermediate/imine deaminase [Microbacterium wangchenii]TFV85018.1 reactive intermediate/imine deaminase [Microbacterium sp. dk485]TXK11813.1 reactive intermediate/imine deaminase [Microbacterium wangchenii]
MQLIHTASAPSPGGHYSQAVRDGDRVFTSGQVGVDPGTGLTPADFREEVRQCLTNLREVLSASGAELTDVIRTMCLLTDIRDFGVFNEEYALFFGDHRPARSTFGIALAGGFRVEIEAIARIPHAAGEGAS